MVPFRLWFTVLMTPHDQPRLRGRQAEAADNDERILQAGLRVLTEDPRAPIAAIAAEAGVGVASLYRRFTSREELARRLALEAMNAITRKAEAASQKVDADPWGAFVEFFYDAMSTGAGSMSGFAGTFEPGEELNHAGQVLHEAMERLLATAQLLGAVRPDINALDLQQIFDMLRGIHFGTPERNEVLRRRYAELILSTLRAPQSVALPGPAPTWGEVLEFWSQKSPARNESS